MLQPAIDPPARSASKNVPAVGSTPRQRRIAKQKARSREQRQSKQQQLLQPEQRPDSLQQQLLAAAPAAGAGSPQQVSAQILQCPHFAACSGCSLDTNLGSPPVLAQARQFFTEHCGFPNFQLSVGSTRGWRQRARLAVRSGPDGRRVIGLFEEGSHNATAIPSCVVHHPAINKAVQLLQQAVAACGVEPYDEASGAGQLRYVQLTCTNSSSSGGSSGGAIAPAVQLVLVWNAAADEDLNKEESTAGRHDQQAPPLEEQLKDSSSRSRSSSCSSRSSLAALADHLWQHGQQRADGSPLLQSVWANFQPARNNTILGPSWKLLHGSEQAWVHLGGADICFGPGSFMQANFEAMDCCLGSMQRYVPAGSTIVDLHAGVGTIGLSMAATRTPRWVRFVEINGQGLPPFQQSAARLQQQQQQGQQLQQAQAAITAPGAGSSSSGSSNNQQGQPQGRPPRLEYHIAAAGSNPARWCRGAEVVVCDPPRKGLEPQLLRWLCSPPEPASAAAEGPSMPQRLLYLSCGFPAFQRDCAALLSSGRWRLRSAEGFLFFPGTDHIETLAVFDAVQPEGQKR